jgi:hypothetical protein
MTNLILPEDTILVSGRTTTFSEVIFMKDTIKSVDISHMRDLAETLTLFFGRVGIRVTIGIYENQTGTFTIRMRTESDTFSNAVNIVEIVNFILESDSLHGV